MRYLTILALIVLSGCETPINNPNPSHLQGKWETLSIERVIPYGVIEFDAQGNGKGVFVDYDGDASVMLFNGFKSAEKSFSLAGYEMEDQSESAMINGVVTENQLCLDIIEEEEESRFCFTKADKVEKFKKIAMTKLESLE